MSNVLDKIVEELEAFKDADSDEGGIADIIEIQSVQKGDPGFLTASEFPYLMVEWGTKSPKLETMGRSGWDVLNHDYTISIMVDNTEYFDPSTSGNDAEGPLEDAAIAMWLWFRRLANRRLDLIDNTIRDVKVSSVTPEPDGRGEVYAKKALLTLTVERQHQHQP